MSQKVTIEEARMNKLLTPREFAAELNVTVSCVRRWLLLRRIESIRVGRLVRIPMGELARLLQEGLVPAKPWRGARQ